LKDESAPDSHPYSIYQVITLKAKAYTGTLLKDGGPPDGSLTAYSGSSP